MTTFHHSHFWRNYEEFSECRSMLSAYLLWRYLEWRPCRNYLEIGVHKGATTSIVLEQSDTPVWLVDPVYKFRDKLQVHDPSRIHYQQTQSQHMALSAGLMFDIVLIDGDHCQPVPSEDVLRVLPHTHDHSVILLDDYDHVRWPGMNCTRDLLNEKRWRPWFRDDQTEWWFPAHPRLPARPLDVEPFMRVIQDDPIMSFATLHRDHDQYRDNGHIHRFTQPPVFNHPGARRWIDPLLRQHNM
jgi:hypothetical protein